MNLLNRIFEYILNHSNSYLFYKNHYESSIFQHNNDLIEIKKLNNEIQELKEENIRYKNQINQINNNRNEIISELKQFFEKNIRVLSDENIRLMAKITQTNSKNDKILEKVIHSNSKNDKLLEKLNQNNVKNDEVLENVIHTNDENLNFIQNNFNGQLQSIDFNLHVLLNNYNSLKNDVNKYLSYTSQNYKDIINQFYKNNNELQLKIDDITTNNSVMENQLTTITDEMNQNKNIILDNQNSSKELINEKIEKELSTLGTQLESNNSLIQKNYKEFVDINDAGMDLIRKGQEQITSLISNGDKNVLSQLSLLSDSNNMIMGSMDKFNDKHNQKNNEIMEKLLTIQNDERDISLLNSIAENNENRYDTLMSFLNRNLDLNKIEIFNRISDDLNNGNYINMDSYKKIKQMGLFDEMYYKKQYDYNLDIDPLLHYIYKGYEENKNPCEKFETLYYKESDDNVLKSPLNPLVYFVSKGFYEGNIRFSPKELRVNHINKLELDDKIQSFDNKGTATNKRQPRLIVSLTSIPERMYDIHYCLYSLLKQEVKPDEIILYLGEDKFPEKELDLPKEVLRLKKHGLTIKFCKDIKSYTKVIPALKDYPDDIIVTADDDIFYPENWLKVLYEEHQKYPELIVGHRLRRMLYNNGEFENYVNWKIIEDEMEASFLNFITGVGGVLYPPHSLYSDVTDESIFRELCEDADDIWLWAMAVLNNTKIKIAKNHNPTLLTYVNPARERNLINEKTLWSQNIGANQNNVQLEKIIDKYPQIIAIIDEELDKNKNK